MGSPSELREVAELGFLTTSTPREGQRGWGGPPKMLGGGVWTHPTPLPCTRAIPKIGKILWRCVLGRCQNVRGSYIPYIPGGKACIFCVNWFPLVPPSPLSNFHMHENDCVFFWWGDGEFQKKPFEFRFLSVSGEMWFSPFWGK